MEIVDRHGLALALIAPAELAEEPWTRTDQPIDVVRLLNPPAGIWDDLARRGFVRKPSLLTWVAELGADEDGFLASLDSSSRKSVRRAQRQAVAAGLRETVEDPVTPGTLDRFLTLYRERVADMRFGVPFALDHRDAVLHGPRKFFGVFAYDGEELVGGCLALECPAVNTLVLRFSAVSAAYRRSSLPRVVYLSVLREARARGYGRATLGNEPNLMGHLTQPGLLRFKTGLGFRAVPSHECADPQPSDEADLVLRLTALNDPTLILGYAGPRLAAHLISEKPMEAAEAQLYTAPFLDPTPVQHRPACPD
ncbi:MULTISPECIES: GNAT family N-acetyltransferase [Streptomyces]|uniref:GNAT family N-acetyltransferase n=1 Tax=Streptomyces caniscabiei TaxID=2746961 RepID=A0ABU4MSK8_9ACTN|nr:MULTISPECIES: GNAT family N-acetyltransferase [Streptomyces]MBE4737361.1 GNAT family N-acetyltransferase [Streptomyces caniscabiei]MBE4756121.1 GNAT family N-acetyltransferase [Streptomyces caniscabiei]MBE4769862.1 GNAT family N-acetyltransferase [Streptomyces caniscabiei]MBE4787192.1 GNAT family N-acetyltransferase [Streptomyces caniscabiei]MBE4795403.1 GNAT family N-acetyltransferase [Streptomyces caniscabiei]